MDRLRAAVPGTISRPDERVDDGTAPGKGWVVEVFNNETNTYDEVMEILMRATGCDLHEAYIETWEIDHLGKSVVHHAGQRECERVAGIIATIGIRVEVREED